MDTVDHDDLADAARTVRDLSADELRERFARLLFEYAERIVTIRRVLDVGATTGADCSLRVLAGLMLTEARELKP